MMAISSSQRSAAARVALTWILVIAVSAINVGVGAQSNTTGASLTARNAAKEYRHKLHRIHGWLLCLGWGFFIPAGIVIAAFRSIIKPGASWWFYVHVVFASGGFLLTLAGVAVGCYFPADNALMVQHKIIGIVVTVIGGLQVLLAASPVRPPKTSMLRRSWNLMHWTLGRAVLALAISNIFIGCYLSHVKHSHIAAQAVVLGALFIIYMLKNDIKYMLIKHTPAEEERLIAAAITPGGGKFGVQMANVASDSKGHKSENFTNGHAKGVEGLMV